MTRSRLDYVRATSEGTPAWLFRVASRPEVGAGHVSRCRALARALKVAANVTMVVDKGAEFWFDGLRNDGFDVAVDGDALTDPYSGCVIDGYEFGEAEISSWAARARRLIMIVDEAPAQPVADLLVGGGAHLQGNAVNGVPALFGPRFALLGPEYAATSPRLVGAGVDRVVVTFGARDSRNATNLVLDALDELVTDGFSPEVTVVLGGRAPHLNDIRKKVEMLGERVALRVDVTDMPSVLCEADLVVGAGGVSLLERMACGVPSITITTAANQRGAVVSAANKRATVDAGPLSSLSTSEVASLISKVSADREARDDMAQCGRTLVDGLGAQRVARELLSLS